MSRAYINNERIFCDSFLNINGLFDGPMHRHKEEAIIKALQGHNLVISTGTGSGKTESFMFPIIDSLLREDEAGGLDDGVRALIIYPMNALVNDQMRRLRDYLKGQKITFGKFTGETKDKFNDAKQNYKEIYGDNPLDNEIISREQIRSGKVPNILVTNYAMLEYLLLRPTDAAIFAGNNANKWKYIVLDEAHTYSGAKGIEVSLLLRRVVAALNNNSIQYILTSATLGNKESTNEIISFARNLCSANFNISSIINAYTKDLEPKNEIKSISPNVYMEIAKLLRENQNESIILNCIKKHFKTLFNSIEESLYSLILHDKFYYKFRRALKDNPLKLIDCASILGVTEELLTDFILVSANAKHKGERLFEAKYHMFIKGIDGIYITLGPDKKLYTEKIISNKNNFSLEECGYKAYEVTFCYNCYSLFIVGQIENSHLIQKSRYEDDFVPEVFMLAENFSGDVEDYDLYKICSRCGKILKINAIDQIWCDHDVSLQTELISVKKETDQIHSCPNCSSKNNRRSITRPFFIGNEAATSVIATGLYNEIPGSKISKTTINEEDDLDKC